VKRAIGKTPGAITQNYLQFRGEERAMAEDRVPGEAESVLSSKRNATRYQILVEIAERQPAVSQREVAEEIGITAQAVSDYLQDLVSQGFVRKEGRGRYRVTKEGVDWLISRTEDLRAYVDHVTEEVVGGVDVETAIAADGVVEGETVSLSMRDGVLHATPGDAGSATAVAVTDAAAGSDVGVTNVAGVVGYDLGEVTVVSVPSVRDGGSAAIDAAPLSNLAPDHDLVAAAGTEALVATRNAGLDPDLQFGTAAAVEEATVKGLDVLLLVIPDQLSRHTDTLRDAGVSYEVVETTP
jgi:putative transcriptional regulator